MTWLKSFLVWFIVIFASLAILTYVIVTFGPLWLVPTLSALVTSPVMVDYMNLRKERKEREEELDADR